MKELRENAPPKAAKQAMKPLRNNSRGAVAVAGPTQIPAPPSARILVVEDNVEIRQLSTQILMRSGGYQVDAAGDGAAGWEALQASNFDLLITDHNMPKLTGVELVKKVRSARMALPVILATGTLPEEELARHPWLQLAATLFKPFSPHQLLATVQAVLGVDERSARVAPEHCFPMFAAPFRQPLPYPQSDHHDQSTPHI